MIGAHKQKNDFEDDDEQIVNVYNNPMIKNKKNLQIFD